jgi:leucyl aminopeptidase
MRARATTDPTTATGADTIAIGLFDGEGVAHDVDGALQALVDSGEARTGFKRLAVAHAGGHRYVLVGLGARDEFGAERARQAAAVALGRAQDVGTKVLCWEVPHHVGDEAVKGLVEGTLLAAYRYDAWKSKPAPDSSRVEELVVSAHHELDITAAVVGAEATNAARDLQNAPSNEATPSRLADRAREIAAEFGLDHEILGRDQIRSAGMGAFAAVAQGSDEEAALITLRYSPPNAVGPVLGFVGKAVTFDSGGLSLKGGKGMSDMKFDMSGGAAVLEATAAIARLGLPVRVIAVVGATENMPSGHAVKPGDIVRAKTGTTIEIINTDAEGRLVLCDCLTHARECGAERLVDVATLTGGVVVALGSVYSGLMGNDDDWCERVRAAGDRSGEPFWRLPLHPDYEKSIEGRYGDLVNANEDRKATSIVGGMFLQHFVADVPWAHLDIAGTGWDLGRDYAKRGGSGMTTRLLIELAQDVAAGS